MSPPHPEAVGTYGREAVAWIEAHSAWKTLRPWQRLVVYRVLEHDAAGALVWLDILLSTPRQVGKSVVLCALAWWRIHQAERFGAEQLVLHTGKDLAVCREVQRKARSYAKEHALQYIVREANGQEEIAIRDGNRWIVRGRGSVYGYTVSLGLVDEVWGVAPDVVEDGIEPTMADVPQPQLLLVSTAHRRATSIMPVRRQSVIETILEPQATLIIEWSAPRATEISDREAWRLCSPHWSLTRERMLEKKLNHALNGASDDPDEDDPIEAFRAQYLNIWPGRRLASSGADEPLVPYDAWVSARDISAGIPAAGLTIAVEDYFGVGAAACAAGLDHAGRVLVWGDVFQNRAEAYAWCSWLIGQRPDSRLIIGASLVNDPAIADLGAIGVETAGSTMTRVALPSVRELVASGRLVHSDGSALNAQVQQLRVTSHREGGLGVSTRSGRHDLARAMTWAAHALANAPAPIPFFAY